MSVIPYYTDMTSCLCDSVPVGTIHLEALHRLSSAEIDGWNSQDLTITSLGSIEQSEVMYGG